MKKYVTTNSLEELELIKSQIFDSNTRSLRTAFMIKGLDIAGSSGLLSLLFPNEYSTVDQFIIKELSTTDQYQNSPKLLIIHPHSINFEQDEYLESILRTKASELKFMFNTEFWTPRKQM